MNDSDGKRCWGPLCNGQEQPRSAFWRDAHKDDGLQYWCRDCMAETRRRKRDADQAAVFAHYGTVCACPGGCGATEDLSIDHVNGDGAEHRKRLGRRGGDQFYAWLIREGFPEGYQVMCRPCNTSKRKGTACRLWHGDPRFRQCPVPSHVGGRVLPLDKFSTDPANRDGLHPHCRDCKNRASRARRALDKFRENGPGSGE